jgi:hypothetical protein
VQVDLGRPLARDAARRRLVDQGFCVMDAEALATLTGERPESLGALTPSWDGLPLDEHLRDGGRYRRRRHGCFVQSLDRPALERAPHRAHWQPTTYNALHGGMERWFAPLDDTLAASPAWAPLLCSLGALFGEVRTPPGGRWFIEAHPFRIDTEGGVGRPTPEGAHRDGVDFVAVLLVARVQIVGGETRVFEADGAQGVRFTLERPWSALLLDDTRVIHETTPIQPAGAPRAGHRDTLVLTYRGGGFQAPE